MSREQLARQTDFAPETGIATPAARSARPRSATYEAMRSRLPHRRLRRHQKDTFRPLEQQMVKDASEYDTLIAPRGSRRREASVRRRAAVVSPARRQATSRVNPSERMASRRSASLVAAGGMDLARLIHGRRQHRRQAGRDIAWPCARTPSALPGLLATRRSGQPGALAQGNSSSGQLPARWAHQRARRRVQSAVLLARSRHGWRANTYGNIAIINAWPTTAQSGSAPSARRAAFCRRVPSWRQMALPSRFTLSHPDNTH
jgi:hypothetical protein